MLKAVDLSGDLASGLRIASSLPGFLRRTIGVGEARATLARRLAQREADFLALARLAIYANSASPYRALLRLAGCAYGDLERLVQQEGLEGALLGLYRAGVYLSGDEFKGRRPAVRGSGSVAVEPTGLRNPASAAHLPVQSGGSRGARTELFISLDNVRERALPRSLTLDARGGLGWQHALWGVPGSTVLVDLLQYCAIGARPVGWFWQVDPAAPGIHPRYRWSARVLRWAAWAAGTRLPRPRYVALADPRPIARWMAAVLRAGGTPHLDTPVSSAVRLCQAAASAGLDLQGAQLTIGSEPITAARVAEIRRTGAEVVPRYATTEAGAIGWGCLAPAAPDDLHLLADRHALIQPGRVAAAPRRSAPGLPDAALCLTSLRPSASVVLLNVFLGDQAELAARSCGCPLEGLGWGMHLSGIRSFEKLSAGGMTFADADVARVLDERLPARFGGGPTDFQLVEAERADGRPQLVLVVHPRVGSLDEAAVASLFIDALGADSPANRVMAEQWRQGDILRVERREPYLTPAGKILHLHQQRPAPSPTAPDLARPPAG